MIVNLEKHKQYTDVIASWLYMEWGVHIPDKSLDTSIISVRKQPDENGLPASLIALQKDKAVGVARLVEHDIEERKDLYPWLASVYVPKEYRLKGIGSALCRAVVEKARENQFKEIYLFTPDRESFYSQQGWKVIEHIEHGGKDAVIMKIETIY